MSSWLIDAEDPARLEVVKRAQALGITGNPDKAAHPLGPIKLADGRTVNAHVVHAVDPIISDGTELVMINRKHDPGMGKPALPGGFLDPTKGGVETAVQAAIREAMEEVGIELGDGELLGRRNFNRPFDVRVARSELPQYGIAEGTWESFITPATWRPATAASLSISVTSNWNRCPREGGATITSPSRQRSRAPWASPTSA